MENSVVSFIADSLSYDPNTKSLVSLRDGVQSYLGFEIGKSPRFKTFTVYRSPDTVRAIKDSLIDLPVTRDHVSFTDAIPNNRNDGHVNSSEIIDSDGSFDSTIAIRNKVNLKSRAIKYVADGRRQVSLGYGAELVPHDKYDFEQINVQPHHMAIVDKARGGNICTFSDSGNLVELTDQELIDEVNNPAMTLSDLANFMAKFPDLIKRVDISKLEPLIKPLFEQLKQEEDKKLNNQNGEVKMSESKADNPEYKEDEKKKNKSEEEGKKSFSDSQEFKDSVEKMANVKAQAIIDSELPKAINEHIEVFNKARSFLDSNYDYSGKTTEQIMFDSVKTYSGQEFKDSTELKVAFKMLKQTKDYSNFGDSAINVDRATELGNLEI